MTAESYIVTVEHNGAEYLAFACPVDYTEASALEARGESAIGLNRDAAQAATVALCAVMPDEADRDVWVVCAPGDPNEAQHEAMNAQTEYDHCSATHYNQSTGAVRFTVTNEAGAEKHYQVETDGGLTEREED